MKKTKLTKFARFVIPGLVLGVGWSTLSAAPARSTATPLQESVRKALVTIPYLSVFDDLSYRVDNGIVTLSGAVTQPYTKDYAEKAVQHLPGVVAVQDQIEVLPLSPFDDQIRVRTFRALNRTGSLYRYFMGTQPSIRIVVKNGHVTLDGFVRNAMDKPVGLQRRESGIQVVFSVTNDLHTGGVR